MQIVGKDLIHSSAKFDYALNRLLTKSGETIERPFVDHPGSVVMIPVLADGRLVMVRQFRHPCNRMFLELPAGTAHRGEPLEQTAVRELAEETGYRTARMERVFEIFPMPGLTNERMAYFRCSDLLQGSVEREVDEEMEVELISLDDALSQIARGDICDGKTIIGVWWESTRRHGSENGIKAIQPS